MPETTPTRLHKPAATEYPILDVIKNRFSPRTYDPRPVEADKLRLILEATRWAPSSMNTQPWRFIIAQRQHDEQFAAMLDVLNEGNQAWAQHAGVLMIAVAREEHDGGYPNKHAEHDTGQALAYLSLQATELGLHLRMMGGFSADKARATYGIPEGYHALTAVALGYLGALEQLDEAGQERERRPRTRKPLSEWVFADRWEHTADLVK
ncbi:MAG: nitroreductase family protein [Anaerolineae bacterium]